MMWLSRIAQWTGGELVGDDVQISAVVTDTRAMRPGCLFVALKGERFDAHDFLARAAEEGAVAALVDRDQDQFANAVKVADTRQGLGRLASGFADQFTHDRLAVTGNAGKTTVKEMAAAMLGPDTLATAGNFNNDIGVPLTLLRLGSEHRHAVIELGGRDCLDQRSGQATGGAGDQCDRGASGRLRFHAGHCQCQGGNLRRLSAGWSGDHQWG